ncbi:hypothetical protein SAMN04487926_15318 [Paraburkholderia steynii]|uniref:Alpha/beta hydrolase n=1 Tax=Paraburkholderia steynii TaxID=1245441 RepID=A0A7Z7FNW2_9BURK|nr:hypothetical protein [Paraburkholderia steynii]SDJ47191.1 hypothetical protein SAMN04487926_15318 [Paraburkholderia steynii]
MDVSHDHVIHSKNGRLNAVTTSVADAQRIAKQAFESGKPNGVVLHFHGGLVNATAALGIATRLASRYDSAGTYPVFSIWESGIIESIRNNLKDILQDQVFHELLKKVTEWVVRKGTSSITTRGAGQTVNVRNLRTDFDRWLNGEINEPPIKDQPSAPGHVVKGAEPDIDDLSADIEAEIELDTDFEGTMAGLFVATGLVSPTTTKGAGITARPVEVLVDKRALDEMFPKQATTTKGGIAWLSVAKFVAKVVIAVIRRLGSRRDHGAYTTIVEEVLRAAYLAKAGEVIWRQMKKDTGDAFENADGAAEVVLQTWNDLVASGKAAPRITLIGHSAGALYINNWIRRSAQVTPNLRYDVVLLAPACRCEHFTNALNAAPNAISNFRSFGMQDALEQQDRLVSVIYPRSLLYFVSGVVEGGADVPLLGMQRYLADTDIFDGADFPAVQVVRDFVASSKYRTVWSISKNGPGANSASVSHSDFDDDETTLDSLSSILKEGY